jgi:hypothetical protein
LAGPRFESAAANVTFGVASRPLMSTVSHEVIVEDGGELAQ